MKHIRSLMGLVAAFLLVFLIWAPVHASSIPIMTKETLKSMLDNPDVVVLDVRAGRDWKSSEFKIKGADRANPGDYSSWASRYEKNKKLVLYCA